ncbi:hypothetical protein VNN28_09775 (plasmid) [Lactococcus formosensis]|uniref:hypothetical protein n=1 Tax=Lactococcus formosensis TaxID=1281486 RepID=UPI0030D348E5
MPNDEIERRRQKEKFYEKDYASIPREQLFDFLNEKAAFSFAQTKAVGFPYWEYQALHEKGFCLGQLVFKEWGKRMSLLSYFDLSSGFFGNCKFMTFRNSASQYMPKYGHLDLSEAEVGDFFILQLNQKDGGSSFIEAIWKIPSGENPERLLREILLKKF